MGHGSTNGKDMAKRRIKYIYVPVDFDKRSALSFEQMIELNVKHESELRVVNFPAFPKGIKPQISRFWKAMSKQKLYRLRRSKNG
tara:strand:+ start:352 stop:606 length:255 start_codon:yes stop_codon:yes gene_type:complete